MFYKSQGLQLLTTLHLDDNLFAVLPDAVPFMRRIQYLDLADNVISSLPLELCTIQL